MAPLPDELVNPLAVVDRLFAEHIATTGGTPDAVWGEREHFVRALGLEDEENFAKIPCLNDVALAETMRPFSLVRYRGLVQDVFEPEIYQALLAERDASTIGSDGARAPMRIVTTKYRECIQPAAGCKLDDLGHKGMAQRGAIYCVPVPGETAWARAAAGGGTATEAAPAPPPSAAAAALKRSRPDEDVEMAPEELAGKDTRRPRSAAGPEAPAVEPAAPEQLQPGIEPGAARTAEEFGLNFPLPSEEQRGRGSSAACIVKLYDVDAEAVKVCEIVEIVGILCVNPEIANFDAPPLWDGGLGQDARQPSTALVPRLHAVVVRHLPFHHPLLPFTPAWLSEARLAAAFQNRFAAPGALAAARDTAIQQLARHLGSDTLAAQYALMLLVSRAFGKHGDKSLGCWALNLMRWPAALAVRDFSEAAGELVPRAVHLDLTAEALDSQRWRPRKDPDANRLVAAQLQLAHGTLLVLDETRMSEGQISADAVKAFCAVTAVVTEQYLPFDYVTYDVKIPLELSCVLVSAQRSIVKEAEVVVPMRPAAPTTAGPLPPQPGSLDAARLLLGLVTRRPRSLRIPDDVAEKISRDFAATRQLFEVPHELCHAWMGLARAHCLTHGEDELTVERWNTILQLEHERLRRCGEEGLLKR